MDLANETESEDEQIRPGGITRVPEPTPKVTLSKEQRAILDIVVDQGRSVFFTGSAGTGKSVLLREIIAALRLKYRSRPDAVAVTASTGIAACNIGGTTIHRFAGELGSIYFARHTMLT